MVILEPSRPRRSSPGVLVQRMFVPADRVIALGIYCRYCILRLRILTELVFGGHDAHQTGGTPDPLVAKKLITVDISTF